MLYRTDIDGLRALAVLAVVFYHFGFTTLSGGYLGVDVFFTISGFLITTILLKDISSKKFTAVSFYLRRILRLVPALLVTIITTWFVGLFVLTPDHFLHLSKSSIAAAMSVSNIFFWTDAGYFSDASITKPLLHSWSLSAEEQFYLIWPALLVCLLAIAKMKNRKNIIWGAIFSLSLISVILCEWMLRSNASTAFYLTPFRLSEFGIGALCIPLLVKFERHKRLSTITFWIGLAALVTCFFIYNTETRFPGINSLIPTLATAGIILGGKEAIGRSLLSNFAVRWIGKTSYSLYLVHWPIVVYYNYGKSPGSSVIDITAMFLISILLATLLYYGVENVFRDTRKRTPRASYPARKTSGLIALMGMAITIGLYGWVGKGLYWRLPQDVQKYVSSDENTRHELLNGGLGCTSTICPMGAEQSEHELLLFVGDSHMHHYFYGFDQKLINMGQKGLMIQEGACPFFTEDIYAKEKTRDECLAERQRFWKLVDSRPSSPIILSQYWGLYSDMLTANRKEFSLPAATEKYGSLELYLKQELKVFIKKLGDRKITIIGPSPQSHSTESVRTCLMKPDLLYKLTGSNLKRDTDICMTMSNKTGDFERAHNINSILSEMAAEYSNVYSLNPFDAFCDEENCVGATERTIYYRDDNHLSTSGAEHFISTLGKKIDFSFEAPIRHKAYAARDTLNINGYEMWFPQAKAALQKVDGSMRADFPNDARITFKLKLDEPYPAPFKLRLRANGEIISKGPPSAYRAVLQRGCSPVPLEGQSFDFDTKSGTLKIDAEMAILEKANCIMIRIWNGEVSFSVDINKLEVSLLPL